MTKTLLTIVAALCLIASAATANDHRIVYSNTISAADTVATALQVDTTYSDWFELRGVTRLQFWSGLFTYDGTDTNFAGDTFFVKMQHGPRKSATDAHVVEIDTFTAVGTTLTWDEFDLLRTDSTIGNWARFMLIHWDSTEADVPGLVNNVYKYKAEVWTSEVK